MHFNGFGFAASLSVLYNVHAVGGVGVDGVDVDLAGAAVVALVEVAVEDGRLVKELTAELGNVGTVGLTNMDLEGGAGVALAEVAVKAEAEHGRLESAVELGTYFSHLLRIK